MTDTASVKPQSLFQLLTSSLTAIKKNFANLLLTIFFVSCLVIVAILFLFTIYYVFLFTGFVRVNFVLSYNIIWTTFSSVVYFIIAIIAQILMINIFFQPQLSFKKNLKSIKKYFWGIFSLTIVLYVLFMFFTLPIYVGIALLALNNIILGLLSFSLGILLAIILVSYLIFSPFILIDQNIGFIDSIKKSIELARKNLGNIVLKIIFLSIILVFLNILSSYLVPFYALGQMYYIVGLLGIALTLAMILILFAYIFSMYQDYKYLKNVK